MENKRVRVFVITLIVIGYFILFAVSANKVVLNSDELLINDVSRLNPTHVNKIVNHQEIEGLQEALAEAREKGLNVSIAGKRHSMGGHAFYHDAVILDMTSFNKILALDPENKIITVQSGVKIGRAHV